MRKHLIRVKLAEADEILESIGVDWQDRKLIWNLYKDQAAFVWIEEGLPSACSIHKGVRHGCLCSPLLISYMMNPW